MKTIREFWKQYEAWAIVYGERLRNDLYLKSKITFSIYLIGMCVLFLIMLVLAVHFVAVDTEKIIEQTVEATEQWGGTLSTSRAVSRVFSTVSTATAHHVIIVGLTGVTLVIIFGILAAKIALQPTRDAIQAQRNFIGHIAHELRTPISIARTNIETTLLEIEETPKEDLVRELQRTVIELDTLAGILNNLVTLNTLTNLEPAEYRHYNLVPILNEVLENLQLLVANKHIMLSVTHEDEHFVWGNRYALKQMIGNILKNAINFTDERGKVSVTISQITSRYIRIRIHDTGIGIPKADLPYIFKPFYRSSLTKDRDDGGSGLGLSIVRELVRLHLGRISFESTEGEGTTVTIDLPMLHSTIRATKQERKVEDTMVSFNYSFSRSATEPKDIP